MDTTSRSERGWRIAVAAFAVVLVAMAGAAVVFLGLAADVVRDEVVLRQRGQVTPATVLEINRSERKKNLPAQVVLDDVGPEPSGRVEVRGVPDGVDVGAVVPVLHDPLDPSRARIATLGWPVVDTLLPLLGVVVSAVLPVGMLRVWLQGGGGLSARGEGVQRSRRRSIRGTRP
jgi:Protein of unknown function (DUF3592)